jgi:glycosyltransferase involved in cell wall biosynthesis
MKVLVRGPALTRTGYGEHCRFVLRALREVEGLDIYLLPVNWGQSAWVWEDSDERSWMDELVKKTAIYGQQNGQYDMSIQVTIPNEWQRMAPVNIGVTAGIETTKVAPIWLQKCNEMDKIITISEHSKQTLLNTVYEGVDQRTGQRGVLKCVKDVDIVHYPVKQDILDAPTKLLDLNLSTKFNFLTVAQWGPRKNLGATINWFVEEFIDNPDVGLVVKTFARGGCILDKNAMEKELAKLLSKYENRQCKVYLLHGDLDDHEMHALYRHDDIHALVSLTHGEGFGLPLFEAAYCGLPVVATDWSGHLDFLYKPTKDKKNKTKFKAHFAKIDYDLQPIAPDAVWDGVLQKDSMWAYAKQGSYKMKMREVYKDYSRFKSQSKKLQQWICENFEEQKQYKKVSDSLKDYLSDFDVEDWLNNLEVHEA